MTDKVAGPDGSALSEGLGCVRWMPAATNPPQAGLYLVWLRSPLSVQSPQMKLAHWEQPNYAAAGNGWHCVGEIAFWADVQPPNARLSGRQQP